MRLIAYGDLYTNYYFKNNLLEYISGGKSNSNILYNVWSNIPKSYPKKFD